MFGDDMRQQVSILSSVPTHISGCGDKYSKMKREERM
jgi:hypothetical protein